MNRRDKVYAHIAALPKKTRIVHIHGYPRRKVLQSLIARLNYIEEVEVTEGMKGHLSAEMIGLLLDHGIGVSVGFCNGSYPQAAQFQNRGHSQKKVRFKRLTQIQRARFKELIDLGIEEAIVLKRYLCLDGEDPVPMHKMPEASKYSPITAAKNISIKIRTVFKYLAPSSRSSNEIKKAAKRLKQKVEKLRNKMEDAASVKQKEIEEAARMKQREQDSADRKVAREAERARKEEEKKRAQRNKKEEGSRILRNKVIKDLGVKRLPQGLPTSKLRTYKKLARLGLEKKGKPSRKSLQGQELATTRAVLRLRYGLSYGDGIYRGREKVAALLGLTTGEVKKLEENALLIIPYAKQLVV